jgi:hypothetical protein
MLAPPGSGLAAGFQAALAARQAILPDRVLQATADGDLWAYGAFAPCAVQRALGLGQIWARIRSCGRLLAARLGQSRP